MTSPVVIKIHNDYEMAFIMPKNMSQDAGATCQKQIFLYYKVFDPQQKIML